MREDYRARKGQKEIRGAPVQPGLAEWLAFKGRKVLKGSEVIWAPRVIKVLSAPKGFRETPVPWGPRAILLREYMHNKRKCRNHAAFSYLKDN